MEKTRKHKSINVKHHINILKNKNHMIISKDAGKGLWQNSFSFMMKTPLQMGTEGTYRNIIKAIYDKLIANILSGKKQKAFP